MTESQKAPDPMADPEGYGLWCEMHACTACDGIGEDYFDDTGEAWVCSRCGGSGFEPDDYSEAFDDWED